MDYLSAIKASGGLQLLNASGGEFSTFSNSATAARTFTLPDFDHAIGRTTAHKVTQTAHGFSVGNAIYYTGSAFAKAKSDALSTCSPGFIVSAVIDSNNFVFTSSGYVSGLSGLTAGSTHYVSETTAGVLTTTEPNGNYWSNPVVYALSTTEAVVFYQQPKRSTKLTSFTPTITAGSGSFTTLTATGQFTNINDYETSVRITVDITNAGSATTYLQSTLPFTTNTGMRQTGQGKEVFSTNRNWVGHIPTSAPDAIRFHRYDGSYSFTNSPIFTFDAKILRA